MNTTKLNSIISTTASVFIDATRPNYFALLLHDPHLYLRVAWPRIRDWLLHEKSAVTKLVQILRTRLLRKQDKLRLKEARKTAIDGIIKNLESERSSIIESGYKEKIIKIDTLLQKLRQAEKESDEEEKNG